MLWQLRFVDLVVDKIGPAGTKLSVTLNTSVLELEAKIGVLCKIERIQPSDGAS